MKQQAQSKQAAKLSLWRWRVFGAAWLLYAGYYLCRKNYPVVQPILMAQFGWSGTDVGVIGSTYLAFYALGQFLWGAAGDCYGARRVVLIGVALSMACNIVIGFCASITTTAVVWGLNGFAQSTGWPSTMKTMAAWFGIQERGRVMAWWSTCYQVGELVSTALASWLISEAMVSGLNQAFGSALSWQQAFWIPAALLGLVLLGFLWGQRNHPEDLGLPSPEGHVKAKARAKGAVEEKWETILEVLRNRYIWILGGTYFCVKFVRYAFMFWLSTYLVTVLGFKPDKAGYMSIILPLAGFFGAVAAGYASDKLFASRRAPVSALMLFGLAVGLYFYGSVAAHPLLGPACLALIGIMTFGPDTLVSATSAMDFGSRHAASTAAGFINGLGSVGAAIQGVTLGWLSDKYGWNAVFSLMLGLALAGALLQMSMWNARGKN